MSRYVSNTDFQAVLTEFTGTQRATEILQQIWMPVGKKGAGAGCFKDQEVARLFAELNREQNPSERKNLLKQIEEAIVQVQPCSFLFHKTSLSAMSKRFALQKPFSLEVRGIHWLRNSLLRKATDS
jgi:ABC-type transport system substrate-binding protein